ncbi:hypothetical protein [Nocardia carnea]|uniref:hypothetical protein n=1 Tax=Nocardia carnea TaxID=37328 RepID=UPI0024541431|nr:hypothetical protein [Nocardia carnea]
MNSVAAISALVRPSETSVAICRVALPFVPHPVAGPTHERLTHTHGRHRSDCRKERGDRDPGHRSRGSAGVVGGGMRRMVGGVVPGQTGTYGCGKHDDRRKRDEIRAWDQAYRKGP